MEEGGIGRSKKKGDGEVDYKTKSGTAWSHSYLNQKPWHPLSYPNQRRKWIAEQTHANHERHAEEIAREYAQEQEFFRQTALISNKDKEKLEIMRAVSFMYVRPPGYDARQPEPEPPEPKPAPKDVFGRSLPSEQDFDVLKNAPRLDTGVAGRAKPFGVEVRNVKCLRCGAHGHQSGDRECPMKDALMPNEKTRLERDDPLKAILLHTDPSEPLKWELKQKPGMSPPRGGFKPDDPNQQIVAEEIFDEYGGFLGGGDIPELLLGHLSSKPKKSRKKTNVEKRKKKQKRSYSASSSSDDSEARPRRERGKRRRKESRSSEEDVEDDTRGHSRWMQRSPPEKRGRKKRRHSSPSQRSHR